jgi:hypothetical protein
VELKRIAIDTSKHVFTLHGVDERERPVLRRNLKREQLEAFFAKQSPTEVVMEACGGAHHWGRFLSQLGHRVRLSALTACRCIGPPCGPIPAQYIKPFVKRAKNDRADAGERIRVPSAVLPRWARRSRSLDALLPILCLRGVSMGDFQEALSALLGKEAPNLSPSVIARLRGEWEADYSRWQRRDLSARRDVCRCSVPSPSSSAPWCANEPRQACAPHAPKAATAANKPSSRPSSKPKFSPC